MPTGVFNPFQLTGRTVIIESLFLLTAVIFIILQKLLYHVCKQCNVIRHYFIHHLPCVYVGSALFIKFPCIGARNYWAFKMTVEIVSKWFFLSALMVYSSVNNLSVISGRFMNFGVKPVLSITYKVSS